MTLLILTVDQIRIMFAIISIIVGRKGFVIPARSRRLHQTLQREVAVAFLGISILLVEDCEPFRRFVSSMLKREPRLQVVCEVENGLEAIDKAKELQPDLILLDIGLPTLNGLEAARQIRKLAPKSKIIFLSQESSSDVVQVALALGEGYVAKSGAGSELLTAVEAVLQGRKGVCTGFDRLDRDTRDTLKLHPSDQQH
jgi:DNA-binding NarL/FixJ family response regulator